MGGKSSHRSKLSLPKNKNKHNLQKIRPRNSNRKHLKSMKVRGKSSHRSKLSLPKNKNRSKHNRTSSSILSNQRIINSKRSVSLTQTQSSQMWKALKRFLLGMNRRNESVVNRFLKKMRRNAVEGSCMNKKSNSGSNSWQRPKERRGR